LNSWIKIWVQVSIQFIPEFLVEFCNQTVEKCGVSGWSKLGTDDGLINQGLNDKWSTRKRLIRTRRRECASQLPQIQVGDLGLRWIGITDEQMVPMGKTNRIRFPDPSFGSRYFVPKFWGFLETRAGNYRTGSFVLEIFQSTLLLEMKTSISFSSFWSPPYCNKKKGSSLCAKCILFQVPVYIGFRNQNLNLLSSTE